MTLPPLPHGAYPTGALVRLLAEARAGSARSRDELLVALHFTILRYLKRQIRSRCDAPDLAEDLAQESLIRIIQRLSDCRADEDGQVHAWALAIARSRLVDHLRTRDTQPAMRMDETAMALAPVATEGGSRPEHVLRRLLREVLDALPPATSDLLRLRANGSLPWEAVGDALQTTPAGAKRRFQRAQARLRQALRAAVAALPERDRAEVKRRFRAFSDHSPPPETR